MKKALYLLFAVSAATFFACSDSSSSDDGISGGTVTETTSGTIVLDEKNQTFTAVSRDQEEVCVKEGFDYSWKTVDWGDDSVRFKYEFVGDTLVLYKASRYYDDEEYASGKMFVGGKADNINGTWKSILCTYSAKIGTACAKACKDVGGKMTEAEVERYYEDLYSNKSVEEMMEMDEDDIAVDPKIMDRMNCVEEGDYNEMTIKISGTSFSSTTKYHYEQTNDFDDYTNSKFMSKFYKNLIKKDVSIPDSYYLFDEDSAGVKDFVEDYEKYNIKIASQTKKSITFKVMDTENITITVGEVSYSGYSSKFTMTLNTSTGSCEYLEEEGEVSKNTCNTGYGEYFDMDKDKDATGKEIYYADEFYRTNRSQFVGCANDLMDSLFAKFSGKASTSDNPLCDSYKEAYDDCVEVMGRDYCESYQDYYESCLSGDFNYGDYSYEEYESGDYESGDYDYNLYKKASSAVAAAKAKKEQIIKTSRSVERSLNRIAQ